MNIKDHVFFITGGGSGLGEATARMIHAHGGHVAVLDLNEERGKKVSEELGGLYLKADITDEYEVQQAIRQTVEQMGGFHGVINCAGMGMSKRVVGKKGPFPLDIFKKVIDVNLIGSFNVIRLAAEAMSENKTNDEGERGIIINTSSVAAFDGQIGQAAYSASKAGIVGMTLPIARELADFGIRVMTIAPGLFDTPLLGQATEEIRTALGKQIPFPPRLGKPNEFALLTKGIIENPMMNGETIRLDGAIRMAPR
ncbi:3-hydroxyacyl-CoA dehydrogenase [Pseudobacillus badius]|uniref:3-hydroxyacyl-CoA dehydrogenase n=1 Tax=Bacillus badius TaxID=1455 RepID=UPI0007B08D9A|nr:3-hydroxyacyl-CoA dehydrogenase [Bacillus badius]KZN99584.1 3-hydroxy-2-methylbutyryl-CoA dehydrogenase [Bacillus badius]OCS85688.1 3-hydroxy-2-methylbutyryl-CoA dehydrogenase [Bacillus badius]OVE51958.1 3-hydroxyacyl-CoA dehydrogenase [Bacillus badius]TDW03394.1 NAD(P)-dependent dehydrogenase (short-subunit alcohol dehydrogenase family) [Bacillus badius]UAT32103.1 3-hydroxyacyl-CoA dehydrogenase [Bacillus badius]